MGREWNYLFGPVPSRRLCLSLGVDIVPLKTCTQNCVYCQLGVNGVVTLERKEYVPIDDVLKELEEFAKAGIRTMNIACEKNLEHRESVNLKSLSRSQRHVSSQQTHELVLQSRLQSVSKHEAARKTA